MEIIKVAGSSIGYPVGNHVWFAKDYCSRVANMILSDGLISSGDHLNLWCQGSSGIIMASLLASNVFNSCNICNVRKYNEHSHSISPSRIVNGVDIIIDDFIASGDTVRHIYSKFRAMTSGSQASIKLLILNQMDSPTAILDLISPEFLILRT